MGKPNKRFWAGVVGTVAAMGGAVAAANPAPAGSPVWQAAPEDRAALVPLLTSGDAGWCMQWRIRIVTGIDAVEGARGCDEPKTSNGPVFAETCVGDGGEEGAFVFVITRPGVASVSIGGAAPVSTVADVALPDGLRATALEALEYDPGWGFSMHCPSVTAFDAAGDVIARQAGQGPPLAYRLPDRTWAHPDRPARGVCGLAATWLRRGTVAWEGDVLRQIGAFPRLLGRALLACARTVYIRSGGHYITAAVLLNASRPGAAPPPLPGMAPLAGYRGIFRAQGSEGTMVARLIRHAWLVATEETLYGLAGPVQLLEHLRANIHVR
jgi:hypothetical protein